MTAMADQPVGPGRVGATVVGLDQQDPATVGHQPSVPAWYPGPQRGKDFVADGAEQFPHFPGP